MARWQPDSRGRLEQAALALFEERGFDDATVADIAARADLTERTFFRYFADKREVLFAGSSMLQDVMVQAVADAPDGAAPLEAVAAGLDAAGALLQDRRAGGYAQRRHAVITANTELQERELIKLATLAAAMSRALQDRGVAPMTASLSGEAGIAVFRVAFERWVGTTGDRDLRDDIRTALDELRAVTAT